jgi:hypothetical protein
VLPAVSAAVPAGKAAHAARHAAVLLYCALLPAQLAPIALQYMAQGVTHVLQRHTLLLLQFVPLAALLMNRLLLLYT